jgi:hypothetical protein
MTLAPTVVATGFLGAAQIRLPIQILDIMLLALVAGGTFTIWRGYDPAALSAGAFVEMHQGAVRGLNTLLPAVGLAANLLAVLLVATSPDRRWGLGLYLLAIALMIAAGLVTRLGNQPINAIVMGWTPDRVPADWQALRDRWWGWHQLRTAMSVAAMLALTTAVQFDTWRQGVAARP